MAVVEADHGKSRGLANRQELAQVGLCFNKAVLGKAGVEVVQDIASRRRNLACHELNGTDSSFVHIGIVRCHRFAQCQLHLLQRCDGVRLTSRTNQGFEGCPGSLTDTVLPRGTDTNMAHIDALLVTPIAELSTDELAALIGHQGVRSSKLTVKNLITELVDLSSSTWAA